MSGRRSRDKGKRGEYEIRDLLKAYGVEARRGIAAAGEPDVVHLIPGVHLEVKRQECAWRDGWMDQAENDSGSRVPVVAYRRNHMKWRAYLRLSGLLILSRIRPDDRHSPVLIMDFEDFLKVLGYQREGVDADESR